MMLVSLCVPCMGRTHDLRRAMPSLVAAANASPPVEIAVLDYNSRDGLGAYVVETRLTAELQMFNSISYSRYVGREHYHLAHAYNLAVRASRGGYVAVMGADAVLSEGYVAEARRLIADGCVWMRGPRYKGVVVVQRAEFVAAGGYDERFEFYGGEDKDLEARLRRRGGKFGLLPDGLVRTIKTPNGQKLVNYDSGLTKLEMILHNKAIRDENDQRGLLVANEGRRWGQWA